MLTPGEAANRLGVSRYALYRMLRDGAWPGLKVGRQWRVPAGTMEQWLTSGQVAERLAVSPRTVYRLLRAGVLPGVKAGGRWRVSVPAVEQWMATRLGNASHPHERAS